MLIEGYSAAFFICFRNVVPNIPMGTIVFDGCACYRCHYFIWNFKKTQFWQVSRNVPGAYFQKTV